MTKKELANIVEEMVQQVAIAHGAKIVTKTIKVGGKAVESSDTEGGMFDLDASRGILAMALKGERAKLTRAFAAVADLPVA